MDKYPHVMIDLETLGNSSRALIVSLGAVLFSTTELGPQFYRKVSYSVTEAKKYEMDFDTVQWWFSQSEKARSVFSEKGDPIFIVLRDFRLFLATHSVFEELCVWGNGSDFDNVILRNAYQTEEIPVPWLWKNNRCYRTLKNLFPQIPKPQNEHNALSDALSQASHAMFLLQQLEKNYR